MSDVTLCPGLDCCYPIFPDCANSSIVPITPVTSLLPCEGLCLGDVYSATLSATGGEAPYTYELISGTLPTGLTFNATAGTITGTTTATGNFIFTIRITDVNGMSVDNTYTLGVLSITTTTVPDYTVGAAYSFQLLAVGGSGTYGWRIDSGSLPDGLSMSDTGLITGTPTGISAGTPVTFELVDTVCEALAASFLTPRVALRTIGTTTIRTKHGWHEYLPVDGTLYKKISWTGFQLQITQTAGSGAPDFTPPQFCGGARFDYAGYSEIDLYGNFIANHSKNLSLACNNRPFPIVNTNSPADPFEVLGYCWAPDPASCSSCNSDQTTWPVVGNYATPSQFDFPFGVLVSGGFASSTQTTYTYNSIGFLFDLVLLDGVTNFPDSDYNGIIGPWAGLNSWGNWTATLSEPFTDAEAEAAKLVYLNNSDTAENIPSYQNYTWNYLVHRSSRNTDVQYILDFSNLIPGQSYVAQVTLYYSAGPSVVVPFSFIATGTTHQITGNVPTPAVNTTIRVGSPTTGYGTGVGTSGLVDYSGQNISDYNGNIVGSY